jgi:hypothetical protein
MADDNVAAHRVLGFQVGQRPTEVVVKLELAGQSGPASQIAIALGPKAAAELAKQLGEASAATAIAKKPASFRL